MNTTKEWFTEFKSLNKDKKEIISMIEENLTEQGFNINKFINSIEKDIKSIEKNILKEKFNINP